MQLACSTVNAGCNDEAGMHKFGVYLRAEQLDAASNHFAPGPSLPVLSAGSVRPKPHGRPKVPPLVDGWQRMCNRSSEAPASEHAHVGRRSLRGDDSWRCDLNHSSSITASSQTNQSFLKACRRLDDESRKAWQENHAVKGAFSARTWGEFEGAALRREMRRMSADSFGGLLDKQLLESDSTMASTSLAASSALMSSVASTMASLAPLGLQRLSKQHVDVLQASHNDFHKSFTENHSAAQHFDITATDWDEVEEELFPEVRPVIDCEVRPVIDCG